MTTIVPNPNAFPVQFQHSVPMIQQVAQTNPQGPQGPSMAAVLGVKTTNCMGIMLTLCGTSLAVLQIVCLILVEDYNFGSAHHGGTGIWVGIIFVIIGIIGISAAKYKTNSLVITFLVFDILGMIIFSPIMIGVTASDLDMRRYVFSEYDYRNDYTDRSMVKTMTGLTSIMLLASISVFVICLFGIVTNSIAIKKVKACSCCCTCCDEKPQSAPIIIYVPATQMPGGANGGQVFTFPASGAVEGQPFPQFHPQGYPESTPRPTLTPMPMPTLMSAAAAQMPPAFTQVPSNTPTGGATGVAIQPPPYQEKEPI